MVSTAGKVMLFIAIKYALGQCYRQWATDDVGTKKWSNSKYIDIEFDGDGDAFILFFFIIIATSVFQIMRYCNSQGSSKDHDDEARRSTMIHAISSKDHDDGERRSTMIHAINNRHNRRGLTSRSKQKPRTAQVPPSPQVTLTSSKSHPGLEGFWAWAAFTSEIRATYQEEERRSLMKSDEDEDELRSPIYPHLPDQIIRINTIKDAIEFSCKMMEHEHEYAGGCECKESNISVQAKCSLLLKYLYNISLHPTESKYRRIRIQNTTFFTNIWITGGRGVLLALGFEERGGDDRGGGASVKVGSGSGNEDKCGDGVYIEMGPNIGPLPEERLKHLDDAIDMLEQLLNKGAESGREDHDIRQGLHSHQPISRGMGGGSNQKNSKKKRMKSEYSSSSSRLLSTSSTPAAPPAKRPAKVQTLNTIDDYKLLSSNSLSLSSTFEIQHIPNPNLPSPEYAQSLLKRIQNEFQMLVQKRGYNVTSVTEMCCCDDGLHYLSSIKGRGGKRFGFGIGCGFSAKPDNIAGYNQTHGNRDKSKGYGYSNARHDIHLRLRRPTNHGSFYPYEDIARTMCHELAHCEVGPHNERFFKVMDEIMEQYSVFLVTGSILDKGGFPVGSSQAYTLGRGREPRGANSRGESGDQETVGSAVKRRLERRRNLGIGRSYVLGGGTSYIQEIKKKENEQRQNGFNIYGNETTKHITSSSLLEDLSPQEAARMAAERRVEERRRIDSQFCLPCEEIQILDWSSSDEEENDDYQNKADSALSNLKQVPEHVMNRDNDSGIDLDVSKKSPMDTKKIQSIKEKNSNTQESRRGISIENDEKISNHWTCSRCTFAGNKQLSLPCEVYGAERDPTEATNKLIEKMIRQDIIEEVKGEENEQSLRLFNGFNIYQGDRQSSSKMKHLT